MAKLGCRRRHIGLEGVPRKLKSPMGAYIEMTGKRKPLESKSTRENTDQREIVTDIS